MKQIIIATIFICGFSFSALAQQNDNSCPEIKVTGPSTTVLPGQKMTFYVTAGNRLTKDYKYFWTATKGTIETGQDTSTISINTSGLPNNETITATVKIIGIPAGGAESGSVVELSGCPSDSFGELPDDNIRNRFDNLFVELKNYPKAESLIVFYFKGADRPAKKRHRLKLLADHIAVRKIDASQITVAIGEIPGDSDNTVIWIVPEGANMPLDKEKDAHTFIHAEYLKEEIPQLFKKKTTK